MLRARGLALLARHGAVSVVAVGADVAVMALGLRAGLAPVPAAVLGFAVGVAVNVALAARVVFHPGEAGRGLAGVLRDYALAGGAGLLWTALVVGALTAPWPGLPPLLAKALAAGTNFFLVYALLRLAALRPGGIGALTSPSSARR